jgi:hypothetical protein
MEYNYIYCIKDGFFIGEVYIKGLGFKKNIHFSKKGKCYKAFFEYDNKISYFINEIKEDHFFGSGNEAVEFFNEYFKKPNYIHLIIEKKIKTKK